MLFGRLEHVPFAFAATASDPHFRQIAGRAAFFYPKLTAAIGFAAMNKLVPINIADVTATAGTNKTNGHDRPLFLGVVNEFALGQHPAMHQHPGPHGAVTGLGVHILGDKPFGKLPCGNAGLRGGWVIQVGRRRIELQ